MTGAFRNKTIETFTANRVGQCLTVSNTVGYVSINSLVMRDITGVGISLYGANGVKYFSGVTGQNINGSAINCSVSSGSFTVTGNSSFNNTGSVLFSGVSGTVSVLNTEIKNAKGSSALSIGANNAVIDAVVIDGVPSGNGISVTSGVRADITNTVIKNCVTTGNGGGISVSGSGSVGISDVTITACKANNYGGGMYLTCSGNAYISKTTIDTVQLTASSGYGGGIYRSVGSLSVVNSVIKNVTGGNNNNCAGIYHSANLEVSGLELRNIPGYGIYSNGSGTMNFSDITAVTSIGGDYGVYSTGISSGRFTLTDSTFNSCGVYCNASGTVPVAITNTDISNAKGDCGLYAYTGNAAVTVEWVTIDGVPNGRGIYINNGGSSSITNTVIKNCVTTGNGGGISVSGSGSVGISDVTITACKANNYGGGMYLTCSGNAYISKTTIDTVQLTASSGYGGGIYRSVGSLSVVNSVIKNVTGGNNNNCAGIYHSASANLEVSGLELRNIPGYGIYSTGSGTMNFSDITAVTSIGGAWGVYSTGISSGRFTLTDSTFNSCGVYCNASGTVPVTITDTEISNAKSNYGLYTRSGGAVNIDRVTIDGVPSGNGISVTSGVRADITNTFINNCVTTGSGGGISVSGSGSVGISDVTITACKANIYGGGMYLTCSGDINIYNTTIENVEARNGGGIYISSSANKTMISGCTIKNAKASNDRGGIYSFGSNDGNTITNSQFINCTATDDIKILYGYGFEKISGCTFTHDANLPDMGTKTIDVAVSVFGYKGGNFENCTFNNLRCNMPSGQNYLFNSWGHYPPAYGGSPGAPASIYSGGNLTLKNCTFNFNSGSAGLCALYNGIALGETPVRDNLLMDGVTINDSNGQRPLIWLYNGSSATSGTYQFKANNTYNGTTLNTAAAITALASGSSNVIRLTDGATPTLVP